MSTDPLKSFNLVNILVTSEEINIEDRHRDNFVYICGKLIKISCVNYFVWKKKSTLKKKIFSESEKKNSLFVYFLVKKKQLHQIWILL